MYKRSKPLAQNANDIIGGSKYAFTDIKPEQRPGSKVNIPIGNPRSGSKVVNNRGIFDKGFASEPQNPYSSIYNTQKHTSNKFEEEFDNYDFKNNTNNDKTKQENDKLKQELEIAKKVINEKDQILSEQQD